MRRDEIVVKKNELKVEFHKVAFTAQDVELANCYNFTIYSDVIICNIENTSKIALFEFMKTAYQAFVFHPYYEEQRKFLFAQLADAYGYIEQNFNIFAKERWEKFDELYAYQKETVMWGLLRKYNLFGLDQGLGKSACSLAVNEILGYRKCLIVAPAACKWNWYEELLNWDIYVHEISVLDSKSPFNALNGKYLIINYDILDKYIDRLYLQGIEHIILDETHKIKNTSSKRSQIMSDFIRRTGAKVTFLSGTPTPNNIEDIYIYLNLAKHPFGISQSKFENRFFIKPRTPGNPTYKKLPKDIDLLNKSIQNFLIRKLKEECLTLPKKNYHRMKYSIGEFKEEYDRVYAELVNMLAMRGKNTDIEGIIQRLNIITAKAKLPHIIKLAEGIIGKKHKVLKSSRLEELGFSIGADSYEDVFGKVIIFSVNTEPISIIKKHFGERCIVVDGSVETRKRLELVNKFKSDNNINVLACNLDAAGIGLNIVNRETQKDRPPICDVIHVNFPLTFAQLEQGNDRVHRIGQYKDVNVYYTIAENTIDEVLINLIEKKFGNVTHLIEGKRQSFDFNDVDNSLLDDMRNNIDLFTETISRTDIYKTIYNEQESESCIKDTDGGTVEESESDNISVVGEQGGDSEGTVSSEEHTGEQAEPEQVQCEEDNA